MEETIKKKAGRSKKIETLDTSKVEQKIISKPKKQKLVLKDDDELLVKSNVFGGLLYINHKTGDETNWADQGDVQPMSARDLKDMKAKQLSFYTENWISIIDSDDVDFNVYTINDIYDALQVGRYYKDTVIPNDLDEIFTWSIDEMKTKIKLMPVTIRETIIIRANDKIKDGTLDSISKVKAIEEVLGCELASPED